MCLWETFLVFLEQEMKTESNAWVAPSTYGFFVFSLFLFVCLVFFPFFVCFRKRAVDKNDCLRRVWARGVWGFPIFTSVPCKLRDSAQELFHRARNINNPKISSHLLLNSLFSLKSKIHFTSLPFSQSFLTISLRNSQTAFVDVKLRKGNPRMATIAN